MFQIILEVYYCILKKEELLKENMKIMNGFNIDGVVKFILKFGGKCQDMIVKIVYDNKKDRELIESVEFSTPFFVEYIDALTKNGLKESYSIKGEFGARLNPFVVIYDNEDKFVKCFWSESGNACQQFINYYKNNGSKN
jgi:hypothetical protein